MSYSSPLFELKKRYDDSYVAAINLLDVGSFNGKDHVPLQEEDLLLVKEITRTKSSPSYDYFSIKNLQKELNFNAYKTSPSPSSNGIEKITVSLYSVDKLED